MKPKETDRFKLALQVFALNLVHVKEDSMHPLDDPRRYQAALHQQAQIIAEAAERARAIAEKGGGFSHLLFILAAIFFKPFAEYCIDLYSTLVGYARSFGALCGL